MILSVQSTTLLKPESSVVKMSTGIGFDDDECDDCCRYSSSIDKMKRCLKTLIHSGCFDQIFDNDKSKEYKALMDLMIQLNFHMTPSFILLRKNNESL